MSERLPIVVLGGGIVGADIARDLVRRGLRVLLVDRGAPTRAEQKDAAPPLAFPNRIHLGAIAARNHVLGGNSTYWGGGLIRPPNLGVADLLGIASIHAPFEPRADNSVYFDAVEREYGSAGQTKRKELTPAILDTAVVRSEIFVLPGKTRNIAAHALAGLRQSGHCDVRANTELVDISRNESGKAQWLTLRTDSRETQVECSHLVICAGAIDSNLFLLRHRAALGLSGANLLGSGLHDHLSVPLFRLERGVTRQLREWMAPKFSAGGVIGVRFELTAEPQTSTRGFLHFQFLFDEVSPYREIKEILALRQRGGSLADFARAGFGAVGGMTKFGRIALERLTSGTLYIDKSVPIIATLDFESSGDASNRIAVDAQGGATLDWDYGVKDESNFLALFDRAATLTRHIAKTASATLADIGDFSSDSAKLAHMREHATDAYHLGGGAAFGVAIDEQLRLMSCANVFVVSAAALTRPGVVNPTLTLLALGRKTADAISTELSLQ